MAEKSSKLVGTLVSVVSKELLQKAEERSNSSTESVTEARRASG